jgi:hypothetical protein
VSLDFARFLFSIPVGQFLDSPSLASLNEILGTISGVGGEVHLVSWSTDLVTSAYEYLSFLLRLLCSLSVP